MFHRTTLPYNQKSRFDKEEVHLSYRLELTVQLTNDTIGYKLTVGPGCEMSGNFQYYSKELFTHNSLNKPYSLLVSGRVCELITDKVKEIFSLYKNIPVSFLNICIKYSEQKKETIKYNLTIDTALKKLEEKINLVKCNVNILKQYQINEVSLNMEEKEEKSGGCTLF